MDIFGIYNYLVNSLDFTIFFKFILGIASGLALVLSGSGGALLTLPFLTEVWNFEVVVAVGTASLFSFGCRLLASQAHLRIKNIDKTLFWIVLRVAGPAALFSSFFVNWWKIVDAASFYEFQFYLKFGIAIVILASIIAIYAAPAKKNSRINEELLFWGGIIIGLAVGLSGVGALVLFLFMLAGVPAKITVGTSLAAGSALTGITAAPYLFFGNIDYPTIFIMLLGAFAGVQIGAHFIRKISSDKLKLFIALIAFLGAIKMLWTQVSSLWGL